MLLKNIRSGAVWVLLAGSAGGLATGLSAQEQANLYTTTRPPRGRPPRSGRVRSPLTRLLGK